MFKQFLYLDEQKMYSLSSQLFEGITEYILNENESSESEETKQNGPLASGRIMADVINSTIKSTEKRFLHDHSFILLENELLKGKHILNIDEKTIFENEDFEKFSFVKVKARAIFNDINKINELFENFNSLGEALTYLNIESEIEKILQNKNNLSEKEQNQFNQEIKRLRKKENIIKLAETNNLRRDDDFLKNLSLITNYGFSEDFEIQQKVNNFLFTSTLNRENLRESEKSLIKKYSRQSEKEIVILGIITQTLKENTLEIKNIEGKNLKEGLSNIIEHLANIELSLFGKASNEIIIDPIAVYIEL
ncbi:DUF6414 family protein [Arcobacter ellisii]|uniref:Uncharacterized protein n=1 Tax=Arcobacter ellisii TaxID=913109 RepID=A0A347UB37_9BACT|nr:hypothetical protein [Arcobacter ellisii]AXX96065.1 hypothetical protein AELL_2448 [Arcobacter ellisii]RXI28930.1 hypothetical protein CP962_12675 [Arcobacter ellisii]